MATRIEVEKLSENSFRVRSVEGSSESPHEVTVNPADFEKLAAPDSALLLRKSFEFLLEREPKESILKRFDLSVISRYFPEYEREIKRRLSGV